MSKISVFNPEQNEIFQKFCKDLYDKEHEKTDIAKEELTEELRNRLTYICKMAAISLKLNVQNINEDVLYYTNNGQKELRSIDIVNIGGKEYSEMSLMNIALKNNFIDKIKTIENLTNDKHLSAEKIKASIDILNYMKNNSLDEYSLSDIARYANRSDKEYAAIIENIKDGTKKADIEKIDFNEKESLDNLIDNFGNIGTIDAESAAIGDDLDDFLDF